MAGLGSIPSSRCKTVAQSLETRGADARQRFIAIHETEVTQQMDMDGGKHSVLPSVVTLRNGQRTFPNTGFIRQSSYPLRFAAGSISSSRFHGTLYAN